MATNNGTAHTFPILQVTGPGRIYHLINYTTGDEIYFDLTLLDGEKATLDLRPGKKTFDSTFRGEIADKILPGSDLESFRLMPGENDVSILIDDASATAVLLWDEYHLSYDGVIA